MFKFLFKQDNKRIQVKRRGGRSQKIKVKVVAPEWKRFIEL